MKIITIKTIMKWWAKFISMVTTKTASINIALKSAKMSEIVFETQAGFVTRGVLQNKKQALSF